MPGIYFKEKNNYGLFFTNKYAGEAKLMALYGLVLFLVPFLSANQLIVGTIVNALLIKSAISVKSKNVYLLSIVPSIAAFSAGFLFGSLTHQVILMLPFIWAGNALLMVITRKFFVNGKKEFFYSNLLAGTIKTAALFLPAIALFTLGLAPTIVLTAFGIMQFATAQAGGAVAIAWNYTVKKTFSKC